VESRHRDAWRRIRQADKTLEEKGREPEIFLLLHTGSGREILHPCWDRSWAIPSEHTIDDLEELGLLRVEPSDSKSRRFSLTMAGRRDGDALLSVASGAGKGAVSADEAPGDVVKNPKKVAVMHGRDRAARQAVLTF
jgi:hypothetical protein